MQNNGPHLSDILAALEKPLVFASKNNFSNLTTVKGLAELIPPLARKALSIVDDPDGTKLLSEIEENFLDFPNHGIDDQKHSISQALSYIHTLKNIPDHMQTASSITRSADHTLQILETPIQHVKGVGPKLGITFNRMNIHTVEDILYFVPRTYIDKRKIQKISSVRQGHHATVSGKIMTVSQSSFAGRKRWFEIVVSDGTQTLSAKWFTPALQYVNTLKKKYPAGSTVLLSGIVSRFRFKHEMHHPEIELLSDDIIPKDKLTIAPVYPLTEGLHQKTLQRILKTVLQTFGQLLSDYLPETVISAYKLISLAEAFCKVHNPDSKADFISLVNFTSSYHRRIVFDEFFLLQSVLALKKHGVSIEPGIPFKIPQDKLAGFLAHLPFNLTAAQEKTLHDIAIDMQKPYPMNRLIQGDVGSGKTVIGLLASLIAIWNGYQAAIMAPTEILAEQHYETIKQFTLGSAISTVLLTSSLAKKQKEEALHNISTGKAHLIIGTHALIQDAVRFYKLGLALIDEQHKFGVMQRAEIKKKGTNPDVLVMTATPIPRTLGLTVYGDLDISVIDELPPGRKPVETKLFHENKRSAVYDIVRKEIYKKNQVFIVYPLVEESDKLDLMDATKMAARLQQDIFPEFSIGLVHGRMSAQEKDTIMKEFQAGRIHILVATTVIEVGIDIPAASLMIIEHAERFGLSQLHQLRGRIGRGSADSMCILLVQYKKSDEAQKRLDVMVRTNDGFKIAEEDFTIRGPGEFLGTRQSGIPDFRIAHIGRDIRILQEARQAAFTIIEQDPQLALPEHQSLKKILLHRYKGRLELAGI